MRPLFPNPPFMKLFFIPKNSILLLTVLLALCTGCQKSESAAFEKIDSCPVKWLIQSSSLVEKIETEAQNMTLEFNSSSTADINKNKYLTIIPKSSSLMRKASLKGNFDVIINLNSLEDQQGEMAFQMLMDNILPLGANPNNNKIGVVLATRPFKGVAIVDNGQPFRDMIGSPSVRLADDSLYQWKDFVAINSFDDVTIRAIRQGTSLKVRITQNLVNIAEKEFTTSETGNFFFELANTSPIQTSKISIFSALWKDEDQGFFDDFSCTNFEQE